MRELPILFNTPMVRAIQDGTKTQTRRVVNHVDPDGTVWKSRSRWEGVHVVDGEFPETALEWCPYGQPGDRLWVRETWQFFDWTEEGEPCVRYAADGACAWPEIEDEQTAVDLTNTWSVLSHPDNYSIDNRAADRKWRPSIHMSRWASRISLEVTGVRVERLQAISDEDAAAEGIYSAQCNDLGTEVPYYRSLMPPCELFKMLWESLNGAGSWDANPWVWVIGFRRVTS